jgi:hypothetical protein
MAVLSEITDLLRHWDIWKRVEEAPGRVDALEKRVTELESRLQRAPVKLAQLAEPFHSEPSSPSQ